MGDEASGALVPGMRAFNDPALGLHDEAAGDGIGPKGLLCVLPGTRTAVAGVANDFDADGVRVLDGFGALATVGGVGVELLQPRHTFAHACATTGAAASRSCTLAAVTVTANSRPRVSTTRWRLRPLTFLPASKPVMPP